MSFVQPIEERPLEQDRFNPDEIEKLRSLLGTLEKPSATCSLALLGKFPISIGLKLVDETIVNSWVIDLGATDHMSHSSHKFNKYNPCPNSTKMVIADGSLTTVADVGDAQISPTLILRNVFHVPKLSTNLVFIQKLAQDLGCNVIFYPTYYGF